MVVLVTEVASPMLRGTLSRWFLELRPGVFVGNISASVRGEIQKMVSERSDQRAAVMIYLAQTEQGFAVWLSGDPLRTPTDFDGLTLMTISAYEST